METPFCLSKKTDGALLGAGIFLSGADLFLDNVLKINRQTFDENRSFEKKSVNGFDRLFMNDYNFLLDKVGGNIFLCSAMASPIFILGKSQKSEWKTVGLMYAETLLIANGIKELAKLSINRYRPMCYFESGDSYDSYKDDGDFANSFPSGHSTMAFAGAAFSSYVFWKYFPESPLRYAVCAGSFSFAAATAVSRVLSGNHFVSDVAVGALIGSCTGFLVPFLHQSKKAETNENIQVGILPNGFLMRLNF